MRSEFISTATKKMLYTVLVTAGMIVSSQILAQDPEFSQYYAAPLYLNPAFTGTALEHRFMVNYRNQWPAIAKGYVTQAFSYDYNLYQFNSGVGFLATHDQAGTAGMRSTQFNFLYSYRLRLTDKWILSSGLNFGYAFRRIDLNKLVFGDQLAFDYRSNAPSDDPAIYNLGTSNYFDFKAGALIYSKSVWLGTSFSHLNRPNRSLINEEAMLPLKLSIHGGAHIPLYRGPFKKEHQAAIAPSFVYKKQKTFEQLDVGVYLLYNPVVFGVWYRGLPILKNAKNNPSQDAIVAILGFQFEKVELSYSYDFTVSELGPISGGSHEVAARYRLAVNPHSQKKRRERYIPCPTSIRR